MPSFLQPDPWLVAFVVIVKFWAAPTVAALAILRLVAGARSARIWAALAFVVSSIAVLAVYAPIADRLIPVLDILNSAYWRHAAQLQAAWGGKAVVVMASLFLWLSTYEGRWRWIDILHGIGALGFASFWVYTLAL
jgi:hypothetical protein